MKIKVMMKDPDTMHDAVQEAVEREIKAMNLPEDEVEELTELRCEKAREKLSKWFKYGEYLAVEIDTDNMTAIVLDA